MNLLASLFGVWSLAAYAAPRELDVVFVLDGQESESTKLLQTYREALKQNIDPDSFTVRFLPNGVYEGNYSVEGQRKAYRSAQGNREAEMVVLLGPQTAMQASRRLGSKPTLMPRLLNADLQGIGNKTEQNRSNVSGLFLLDSPYQIQDDIATMSAMLNFTHLGVIVDRGLVDAIGVEKLEDYFKSTSLNVRRVSIISINSNAKGVLSALGSIQDGAEAIYVASAEQLSPEERSKLISGLNQLKIPSMSRLGHEDVELGTVIGRASASVEMDRARRTAVAAEKIMSGNRPQQLPIHYTINGHVQINMATAISLGISPAWSVLSEAEVVGVERLEEAGLSLESAMVLAERHPLLKAAEAGSRSASSEWARVRSAYLPQLHAFATGSAIDKDRAERLLQLQPQLDVAAGGQLTQQVLDVSQIVRIKAQRSEAYAAEQDIEGLKQDVREDVALAYLALLHGRVVEQAYRDRLADIRNLRDVVRRRADQDELAQADVAFMDAQTTQMQQKLLEARERSRTLEIVFNQVVGQPVEKTVSLSDQDLLTAGLLDHEERLLSYVTDPRALPTFLSAVRTFGIERSSSLAAANHRLDSLKFKSKAAKSDFYAPTISLYGNASYHFLRDEYSPMSGIHQQFGNYNDFLTILGANSNLLVGGQPLAADTYSSIDPSSMDLLDWEAGLQVRYPLFNGLARRASRDQSQANLEAGLSQFDVLKNETESAISESFIVLNSNYRAMLLSKQARDSVATGFNAYTKQYERGERSILELNSVSMLSLEANIDYIDNIHAFRSSFISSLATISSLEYFEDDGLRQALFDQLAESYAAKGYFVPEQP